MYFGDQAHLQRQQQIYHQQQQQKAQVAQQNQQPQLPLQQAAGGLPTVPAQPATILQGSALDLYN